jgi:NitT/TauT family transport system substrate-binding protein
MTGTRRRALAVAAAFLALLPLGGVAQTAPTIVVGGVLAEDTTPLWYGVREGLFRRAGLNVEYQRAVNGTAATLGVLGGTFQIADTNSLSVVLAHAKNVPLTIIAPTGLYNGTTDFVAAVTRKDSPLKTAADLNGKLIGSPGAKDLNAVALLTWIDAHGGDSKSVKVIEIPYSAMPAALEEGRIDVGTILQPFLSQALAGGKVQVFANSYGAIAPRFVLGVWVTQTSWADANADTVRKFARVIREGAIWVSTHKTESAELLSQNTGVEAQNILKGGREPMATTFIAPPDVQPLVDIMSKFGVIDKRFDAAEIISPVVRGLTP